jgi:hypothetical protein
MYTTVNFAGFFKAIYGTALNAYILGKAGISAPLVNGYELDGVTNDYLINLPKKILYRQNNC